MLGEHDARATIGDRHRTRRERRAGGHEATGVEENRLLDASRASVVKQQRLPVEELSHQAQSPEGRRAPLTSGGRTVRTIVGKLVTHVVKEQVRVELDRLTGQRGNDARSRLEGRRVATAAADLREG